MFIIPQSTTQGSPFKNFSSKYLMTPQNRKFENRKPDMASPEVDFFKEKKNLALQFREGRDKGNQTKCLLNFSVFFCLACFLGGYFFLRFFIFCDRCLPSVSLGRGFEPRPSLICGPLECGLLSVT